jgi:lipid-binding SYLF domain-containing protein
MRSVIYSVAALCLAALAMGCSTTPKSEEGKEDLQAGAQRAVDRMTAANSGLRAQLDKAHGYAVFPKVGKGGVIVGGAYGRGIVYEQSNMIGYADLTQASVGAQLGGQTYSELIVFENKAALDRFRQNSLEFSANASAVIVKSGAGTAARYENGVAIYIMPRAGAMAEASVGGQKFTFVPDTTGGTGATTRGATTRRAT